MLKPFVVEALEIPELVLNAVAKHSSATAAIMEKNTSRNLTSSETALPEYELDTSTQGVSG